MLFKVATKLCHAAQTGKVEIKEMSFPEGLVEFSTENFQVFPKPKDFGLYHAIELFCFKVDRNTGLQAGPIVSFLKDKVFHLQNNQTIEEHPTLWSDQSNCTPPDKTVLWDKHYTGLWGSVLTKVPNRIPIMSFPN